MKKFHNAFGLTDRDICPEEKSMGAKKGEKISL